MDGNPPWGSQGPPTPQSGAQPPQPMNVGPPPPWPPQPVGKRPRRGVLVPIGVGLAVLLSAASLVFALVKGNGETSPGPVETQEAEQMQVFVDDPDRELCRDMGPLMNEHLDARKAFLDSGQQNTPERKAAIPKFVAETYDWAPKAQDVLNQHSDPQRFLPRNYQRFIDDAILYAEGLAPDRDSSMYENQVYEFGTMDLAGLIGRCTEVDVQWWK